MSTSDSPPVQIEREGILVKKEFVPDEFAVPIVRFEFESTLDEPVLVRLLDSIPTEFDLDENDPGFHPDFEGEFWELLEGNRVRFERVVQAGESFETLYGVPGPTIEDAYLFETDPTIYVNEYDPESDESDSDGVVEDEIDLDNVSDGTTEDVEGSEPHTSESPDDHPASTQSATGEGVAPERLTVQLNHLQSQMAEFEAYIDALGEFIDEEGTAQQALAGYKNEVSALRETVDGLGDGLDDDVEANRVAIDDLSNELDSIHGDLEQAMSFEESFEASLDELEESVPDVGAIESRLDDVEGLDERVEALEELRSRVEELEGLDDRVESVQDDVEALSEQTNELSDIDTRLDDFESAFDARLEELEGKYESMSERLDTISQGFDVMRQAFGGSMDTGSDEDSSEDESKDE